MDEKSKGQREALTDLERQVDEKCKMVWLKRWMSFEVD